MRRPIFILAILAGALAFPPAAAASTTDRIVQDCQHSPTGELTGHYTRRQLQRALHSLPGDVLEYSGCYDAINQALLDAAISPRGGGGGTTGGGTAGGLPPSAGGGTTPGGTVAPGAGGAATPPHTGSKAPVAVDGGLVAPGRIPTVGRDAHALPTPLIVLLALLGAGALAPALTTLGRRVIARRHA